MTPTTLMPTRRYKPLGVCMYCLQAAEKLTEEHIFPEAIGGKWKLPASVCANCQTIVNKPEALVLQGDLYTARLALEIRRKKHAKKERRDGPALPRKIATSNGPFGQQFPEPDYQPAAGELSPLITLLQFLPPSRLPGLARDESQHAVKLSMIHLGKGSPWPVGTHLSTKEPMHPWEYAYSIAKWGYAFAVAERGLECCDSSAIRDLLLGHGDDPMSFAGGIEEPLQRGTHLHWAALREEGGLLVARLHLFASAGARPYDVVVGRLMR